MDPKAYIAMTEAELLTDLGERLHYFFAETHPLWTSWDDAQEGAGDLKVLYQKTEKGFEPLPPNLQKILFFKREEANKASAIQPIAQLNMVANVTFHLMSQQLALILHEMPEMNKEKALKTTFENITKLVNRYEEEIQKADKESKDEQTHGKGNPTRSTDPSGLSH